MCEKLNDDDDDDDENVDAWPVAVTMTPT